MDAAPSVDVYRGDTCGFLYLKKSLELSICYHTVALWELLGGAGRTCTACSTLSFSVPSVFLVQRMERAKLFVASAVCGCDCVLAEFSISHTM